MDVKQLKYFVTVANEKQITKAAQKLYMAQPPLSRQILSLEKELGTTLFDRSRQGLELTEAGQAFLIKAQEILAQMEDLQAVAQKDPQEISGLLNIGTLISCISILAKHLAIYHQKYPSVTYKLWEDAPHMLLELLKKREVELLFLRTPTCDPGDFASACLGVEEYYLAVPENMDPYPDQDEITLEQSATLPLILLHEGRSIGYNELILQEFIRLNLKPNIICQCSNSSLALLLIMGGMGATIMPQWVIMQFANKQIKCKRIVDFFRKNLTNCGLG